LKNTTQEKVARERMAPGMITALGFLGEDGRGIADIVAADEEEFARLGLTFDTVVAELGRLRDEGSRGLGEALTVDGKWIVMAGDARGVLPCPWNDGVFHKNGIAVRRIDTGESLIYSDLSLHLLQTHHFCQGRAFPFRLEPSAIARVIGK
jgi:hypothetical protein